MKRTKEDILLYITAAQHINKTTENNSTANDEISDTVRSANERLSTATVDEQYEILDEVIYSEIGDIDIVEYVSDLLKIPAELRGGRLTHIIDLEWYQRTHTEGMSKLYGTTSDMSFMYSSIRVIARYGTRSMYIALVRGEVTAVSFDIPEDVSELRAHAEASASAVSRVIDGMSDFAETYDVDDLNTAIHEADSIDTSEMEVYLHIGDNVYSGPENEMVSALLHGLKDEKFPD